MVVFINFLKELEFYSEIKGKPIKKLRLVHAKLASAILLIIKAIFFDNGDSSLAQTTFAPVLFPEGDIAKLGNGKTTSFRNLF